MGIVALGEAGGWEYRWAMSSENFKQQREAAYVARFGVPKEVIRSTEGPLGDSPLDLFLFEHPRTEHEVPIVSDPYVMIVSSGMSDTRMPGMGKVRRAELVAYVRRVDENIHRYLFHTAAFPRMTGLPIGVGSTLKSDVRYFPNSSLDATVFFPNLLEAEAKLFDELVLDGTAVAPLIPVPLSPGEHQFVVARGLQALADRLETVGFDLTLNPDRRTFA
jgi:hypothetical protein